MNFVPHSTFNIPESADSRLGRYSSRSRGALLLELLIVTSILAVILSIGSQAVYVSMQSGKTSAESDTAVGLANEALEAVRAVADEKWQNIYGLSGKGTTHYETILSGNKWVLASGDESIALNTANFTRYIIIDNVSRDPVTREIEFSYNSENDDPSTQQIAVTVSWQGSGSPVTISEYLLRWRNKVCNQTDWSGGVGSGAKNCPDNTYGSQDGNLDTSGGTLKLQ